MCFAWCFADQTVCSTEEVHRSSKQCGGVLSVSSVHKALDPLVSGQKQQGEMLQALHGRVVALQRMVQQQQREQAATLLSSRDFFLIAIVFLGQILALWVFKKF